MLITFDGVSVETGSIINGLDHSGIILKSLILITSLVKQWSIGASGEWNDVIPEEGSQFCMKRLKRETVNFLISNVIITECIYFFIFKFFGESLKMWKFKKVKVKNVKVKNVKYEILRCWNVNISIWNNSNTNFQNFGMPLWQCIILSEEAIYSNYDKKYWYWIPMVSTFTGRNNGYKLNFYGNWSFSPIVFYYMILALYYVVY